MTADLRFDDLSYDDVEEAVIQLRRRGEAPDIDRLVAAFPHLKNDILELLPATLLVDEALNPPRHQDVDVDCPKTINGCIVEGELGRGGMGVVYRAYQPAFDRAVAIKVIPHGAKKTARERFHVERKTLSRLHHPNIVSAYSFESDQSNSYLMMEIVEGYSLQQLMEDRCNINGRFLLNNLRTNPDALVKFAKEIVSGIHHAHDSEIIHRDIKPGNLLIDFGGKGWITDFGLAKARSVSNDLSKTGDVIGTPLYMAPEQARGIVDARSDIYSFGLVLLEILIGRQAFLELRSAENRIDSDEIARLSPKTPEGLIEIIIKACCADPACRFQSAGEMYRVLERFEQGKVPDRRSGRRMPDEVYKKQFAFKSVVTVLTSICLFGGSTAIFLASQNNRIDAYKIESEANEPLQPKQDALTAAGIGNPKVGSNLSAYPTKRQLAKYALIGSEEQRLGLEFVSLVQEFKNDRQSALAHAQRKLTKYQESAHVIESKLDEMLVLIERSEFDADEKRNASELIQQYSNLVVQGAIEFGDVEHDLSKLALVQAAQDTSVLRAWLGQLRKTVNDGIENRASYSDSEVNTDDVNTAEVDRQGDSE